MPGIFSSLGLGHLIAATEKEKSQEDKVKHSKGTENNEVGPPMTENMEYKSRHKTSSLS